MTESRCSHESGYSETLSHRQPSSQCRSRCCEASPEAARAGMAGVLIAFYVLSVTYIAPTFGVGNAVFFVLLGQLVAAAAIDHFGLFGAQVTPLSATRAAGIALMAAGVALTQKA